MNGAPPQEGTALIDVHSHHVPGVDDGARTLADALRYLAEGVDLGVTHVVTTPHLSAARATGRRRREIEEEFASLAERVADDLPQLSLSCSYEIRLDEPDADLSDPELGLEGGGRLLVEFPMLMIPAYPDAMLEAARSQGWVPVLAHPERYAGIERAYRWIERWRSMGVVLAVNAGSLWGEYGPEAERVSRRMLSLGHVDLIASDHHARPRRSTTIRAAWDFLCESEHEEAARLLLSANPGAVLAGKPTRAVPPIDLGGWFGKLRRFVRGTGH